jgi:hypothetical protein
MTVALALRDDGMGSDEVHRCLSDAGFDAGPIAHLL